MDYTYGLYAIVILALIIVGLEFGQRYLKQRKEGFENFENPMSNTYFQENTLISYGDNITGSAVNIRQNSSRGTPSTFGTSGARPSFLGLPQSSYAGSYYKCPSCELQFDCSNYPYEIDDKHGAVCTNCIEKKLYNDYNLPVFAKSVGSPRKCKDLL